MRRPLEIEKKLETVLLSLLERSPIEVYGIKVVTGNARGSEPPRSTVRVYIDKEGGVTIDDVASTSRRLGAHLEVEGTIPGHYILEVSSPGLDRVLFKPEHFLRQIGQKIQITLSYAQEDQKNFQGILKGVEGDNISLLIEKDKKQAEKV